MSRLILLNLPPTLTQASLRSHLTSPPSLKDSTITDIRLVPKRRFAFVGYKTEDEARRAKEWFDGTFALGGGKVKVDFVKDEPLAPKAKRAKTGNEPKVKDVDTDKEHSKAGPLKRLQEFMDVMKGQEGVVPGGSGGAVPGEEGWVADGLKGKDTAKVKESKKGKEKSVEPEQEDVQEEDDDAAWLKRRQTAALGEGSDSAQDGAPRLDSDSSLILSTGRLFVRNLPFSATQEDLESHFGRHGHLESVHLPVSHSGEPLGTAFILFRDPNDALTAYKTLDKTTFQGRLLHVLPGRARPGQEVKAEGVGEVAGGVLGKVKQGHAEVAGKADAKRKADSAKGVNWATLYMNSDAVAASVADRMGISKSELLSADPSTSSVSSAVKLALAETHVIAETKQYFADAGLNIDSLQPKTPRSQTVILVKNIPYGTTIHTLTDLFAGFGETTRILLPPAGTIGVVEYKSAADAGRAFKGLAYKRLGNAVLYLEKGPVGMFNAPAGPTPAEKEEAEKAALVERVIQTDISTAEAPAESDESGSTIFLKNLSFNTTTQRLQSILSSLPGYSFARVQMKPDPKRPGEKLSMGYGFVGFKTRQEAQRALGGLEGFEIDGKSLEAKFAQRGAEDDKGEPKGKSGESATKSTKLLVKNLPFETSKKEVRELFSAYGTVKSLRVPKKAIPTSTGSQSTRGFAFLEFTTHAEALRAMEALKHTHLLGRHLVLEWAREGEGVDVDKLREKVKGDVRAGQGGGNKGKRKLDLVGGNGEDDGMEV